MKPLTRLLAILLVSVAANAAATSDDAPRLVFTKVFPGSLPAYTEVAIEKDGSGTYREDAKDDDPVKFQLSEAEVAPLRALAAKLGNFTHPVESGLKVANMGMKTFHYEGPAGTHEVKFNYSEDADAKALADLFEQIGETERAWLNLDRVVHFDKLGAQDAVLRVESLRDQKRLLPESQFLPLLDRIAKNESFLHMARDRAATLAENIRKPK